MDKCRDMASNWRSRYSWNLLRPLNINVRKRARSYGAPRPCVSARYRRVHCWISVAPTEQAKQIIILQNHATLTRTTKVVGLNGSLLSAVMLLRGIPLEMLKSC